MRLLVDTHILLWAQLEPDRLSETHVAALTTPGHEVFFSAASIWEIAIKAQLKRAVFDVAPDSIARAASESGMRELPVQAAAAAGVSRLPLHHSDPFDRLLVCQAMSEGLTLVTVDAQLRYYSNVVRLM